jgi:acyl carrier protein
LNHDDLNQSQNEIDPGAPPLAEEHSTLVDDIRQVISRALQVPLELVTPELEFGDLPEWDSMGHMEIMLLLEEGFNIEASTETISKLTSVPAICRYLLNSTDSINASQPADFTRTRTPSSATPEQGDPLPEPAPANHIQDGQEDQEIFITPILPIPEHLLGDIKSKLAYVDESIRLAQVSPKMITLTVRKFSSSTTSDGQKTPIEEKVQHVVLSMVKTDPVRGTGKLENIELVLEDHLDRPILYYDDPMPWLIQHGEVNQEAPGIYSLGPLVTRLISFFEQQFLDLAKNFEAVPYRFPTLIPARYMERVNYFRAFPHSLTFATHLREDLDVIDEFSQAAHCGEDHALIAPPGSFAPVQALLSPAVCYHLYFALADKPLPGGKLAATAVSNCFRYEAINLTSLERMWNFSMREIIFVGPKEFVLDNRETARLRMAQFFEEIGLAYRVENANDPFFIGEFRKQTAFQSAFQLKFEIRARLPYKSVAAYDKTSHSSTLAVGSYNYHQDFFGRALHITLPDETPAHTGCVAFGLERIALAFLAQFGPHPGDWPAIVRNGMLNFFDNLT